MRLHATERDEAVRVVYRSAIIAPGLHLAFIDRERVRLDGKTILGELASRDVWVAGPGPSLTVFSPHAPETT